MVFPLCSKVRFRKVLTSKNATVVWGHTEYPVVCPHVLTAAGEAVGKKMSVTSKGVCSNEFVEQPKALHPLSRLECITCA